MNNTLSKPIAPVFQKWIDDPNTKLPETLGIVLTPVVEELGKLTVIHPTTNDPVIVSEKYGTVALWINF